MILSCLLCNKIYSPLALRTGISLYNDSTSSKSFFASVLCLRGEATFYYSGLSSSPRLVYRTGSVPWTEPTGPEAYRDLLDSAGVRWTTLDVVRFLKVGEAETVGPVVL